MARTVIDLSQTPIIMDLVERSASGRVRLAGVESVQAQTINEVITRLDQILILLNGGVIPPLPDPISITGTPPTTGTVGQPYTFTPVTANGAGTKVFALTGGTLLGGLTFSTTTGAITGTPNVAGTMSGIVVRVTDDTGSASTTATNVTIAAATVALSISGTPPTTGQVGTAYSFAPTAAGGSGTKVYSLAGGTLVAGLALDTTTGAITGTPTAAGTMTGLSVRVTDDSGSAATVATTVTIAAAGATTYAFDPIVQRSGQQDTWTLRRTGNLSQAESKTVTVAGGSRSPASVPGQWPGSTFPTVTANFAANSPTATVVVTAPANVQPE